MSLFTPPTKSDKMNTTKLKAGVFAITITLAAPGFAIEVAEGCTGSQAAVDKNIFNWRYYLNSNADVAGAGVKTASAACTHWLNHGLPAGRQAHPGFHSSQYLARYPDLLAAFGKTNYIAAVNHYIQSGIPEGRIGYQDNGISLGYQTTTISNQVDTSKIFMGISKRTAGAVDSLMFDNVEFINATDHGRELQIAGVSSWEEGYNPTEAGSCNDGSGYATSSSLNTLIFKPNSLFTSVTPAFWRKPGNTLCGLGNNTTTSAENYRFHKNISIGEIPGMPNVIHYAIQVDINEHVPQDPRNSYMRFELPTAYHGGDFNRMFQFNKENSTLIEITNLSCMIGGACASENSLIYATANLSHALGVCAGREAGADFAARERYLAFGNLDNSSPFASTTKWSVVRYIHGNVSPGTVLNFNSYLAIAKTLDNVSAVDRVKLNLNELHQTGHCI